MITAFLLGSAVGGIVIAYFYDRECARMRALVAFRDHRIALLEAQVRHPSVRVLRAVGDEAS